MINSINNLVTEIVKQRLILNELERYFTSESEVDNPDENYYTYPSKYYTKSYLRSPATISRIARFEDKFGISLPEDYKLFLANAGNGGNGPDCELYSLEKIEATLQKQFHTSPYKGDVSFGIPAAAVTTPVLTLNQFLSTDFPLSEDWRLMPIDDHIAWVDLFKNRMKEWHLSAYWSEGQYIYNFNNAPLLSGCIQIGWRSLFHEHKKHFYSDLEMSKDQSLGNSGITNLYLVIQGALKGTVWSQNIYTFTPLLMGYHNSGENFYLIGRALSNEWISPQRANASEPPQRFLEWYNNWLIDEIKNQKLNNSDTSNRREKETKYYNEELHKINKQLAELETPTWKYIMFITLCGVFIFLAFRFLF